MILLRCSIVISLSLSIRSPQLLQLPATAQITWYYQSFCMCVGIIVRERDRNIKVKTCNVVDPMGRPTRKEPEKLMVASACVWNSKSYRPQVNHDHEHYKATRDTEIDECGGDGRECSTLCQVVFQKTSEFVESNHTAFIYFDIFFRPEKRHSQRDRDQRERGQTDLAHQLPQHRAVVRHASLSLPAQK